MKASVVDLSSMLVRLFHHAVGSFKINNKLVHYVLFLSFDAPAACLPLVDFVVWGCGNHDCGLFWGPPVGSRRVIAIGALHRDNRSVPKETMYTYMFEEWIVREFKVFWHHLLKK